MCDNTLLKPTRRGTIGYAAYYFILCMCFQAFGGYSSLYYGENGCSDFQIGIIKGAGQFCFIFSMIFFGKLADKMKDKNLLSFITLLLTAVVLLITPLNKSFVWMLVCAVLYLLFNCNQQHMDVITLDYCKKTGGRFGWFKIFGTLGSAVLALCINFIVGDDYDRIFYIAAAVALLSALIVILLPRDKTLPAREEKKNSGTYRQLLSDKRVLFLLFLICFMFVPLSFHSAFSALRLKETGGDLQLISLGSMLAMAFGLPFSLFVDKLRKKLGDNCMMTASAVAYLVLYVLYAIVDNAVALIIISAISSLFTGGIVYCTTVKMSEIVSPSLQAKGQMCIGIAGYGVAMSAGAFFGGLISDTFGLKMSYVMCAAFSVIPLVMVVTLWIYSKAKKRNEAENIAESCDSEPEQKID